MYYNRKTKTIEKAVEGNKKALDLLYNTQGGRFLLWGIAARPWFSEAIAHYHRSTKSHKDIVPFIKKYEIKECPKHAREKYKTFNDFFIREKKIKVDTQKNALIAPADSKMRYFTITDDLRMIVKSSNYSVADILGSTVDAQAFKGGTYIIFRLSVDDYHRYHFIDNGRVRGKYRINGELHTVRPISEQYNVYARNTREITMMDTENFGQVAQIDVGALLVGKIVNYNVESFTKGQEKGYFEFGGSTIVMLFNKEIQFDEDIIAANKQGYEIKVSAGERIGLCLND